MGRLGVLLIVAALALPWQPAAAADPCAEGELHSSAIVGGDTLQLNWAGTVTEKMAPVISAKFEAYKRRAKSVELSLQSCGGRTDYMAEVIGVLRHIKTTHELTTVVPRGATCASACIPIFLASDRRTAALSSLAFPSPMAPSTRGRRRRGHDAHARQELSGSLSQAILRVGRRLAGVASRPQVRHREERRLLADRPRSVV